MRLVQFGYSDLVDNGSNGSGEVTFYLMRHGKTMLNMLDRIQGWSDAFITPEGEEVVKFAGKGLKDISFTAAYSSDSGRAMQTARMILDENENSDINLIADPRLREYNFGSYEGDLNESLWTDIADMLGINVDEIFESELFDVRYFHNLVAELDRKKSAELINKIWLAENYDEIKDRLLEGFTEIAKRESKKGNGNVLVVSHGVSISTFINLISPESGPQMLENACVNIIKYKDDRFTVESINDMSYIEKGRELVAVSQM